MERKRRIFIGGTGRSGTSILYSIIRSNPEIHAFKNELRFITDDSGLISLMDALSTNFSQVRARASLHRFERLMKYDMVTPTRTPYPSYNLKNLLGAAYLSKVDSLLKKLTYGTFSHQTGQQNYEEMYYWNGTRTKLRKRKSYTLDYHQHLTYIPKYFSDRNELERIVSSFIEEVFSLKMNELGRKTWCEKTPANLDHFQVLHSLFPDALFVHIKRDPRGVVHSLMNQSWAPTEVKEVCLMLKGIYSRWLDVKNKLSSSIFYLEIKLEEFAREPEGVLNDISELSGVVNDFTGLQEISVSKVNYWQDEMSLETQTEIESYLSEEIRLMGYE